MRERHMTAARILRELCDRDASIRDLFFRNYVEPHFEVTIEDVDVAERIMRALMSAFAEPEEETWPRLRAVLAVLEGKEPGTSAPPDVALRASRPAYHASRGDSPWAPARGISGPGKERVHLEPVTGLAETAAVRCDAGKQPALPFEPGAQGPPKLTLELYARYRVLVGLASSVLASSGVDAAKEEAAWGRVLAVDPTLVGKLEELTRRYDAWWRRETW
jgi:hypothetical protein